MEAIKTKISKMEYNLDKKKIKKLAIEILKVITIVTYEITYLLQHQEIFNLKEKEVYDWSFLSEWFCAIIRFVDRLKPSYIQKINTYQKIIVLEYLIVKHKKSRKKQEEIKDYLLLFKSIKRKKDFLFLKEILNQEINNIYESKEVAI